MVMYSVLRKSILIGILLVVSVVPLHAASDLVVTTVANLPETLTPAIKFSLITTVANQGDAVSPETVTNYYLSSGTSKAGAWLLTSKHSVKGLAPLANTTKKVKITVPSGIPSGAYYLVACADDTNLAPEDNEDNNCTPSAATTDLVVPDLLIKDISALTPGAALKTPLSITTSVSNEGTYPSGPSRTYYYWSPDTTINPTLKPIKQSVPPINPKEISTTTFSLKTPKTPGTYYLIACADGANKVKEEDETNNCLASPTPLIVGTPAISFSSTTYTGKFNSLPPGTSTIQVTFDGVTREAPASDTTLISFASPDGDHSYSAQALSGTTVLASLGPISITTFSSFPLNIPLAFSFPSFDTYKTDIGLDTPNTLIYLGDDQRNRIVQYGGSADDLLSVDTGAGNDWIEQYGGGGGGQLIARVGSGNDYIFQKAGDEATTIVADGAFGNDCITIIGGQGNDSISITGGEGDDVVQIESGSGDDSIIVSLGNGNNIATIDGGTGTDTLTVNNLDGLPLLIQDAGLNLIYGAGGGTTITVTGIEQITVNGAGGNPIFTWP